MFTLWTEKTDALKEKRKGPSVSTELKIFEQTLQHQLSATYNAVLRSFPRDSHLKLLLIMTDAFFHTVAHVVSQMINSDNS